MNFRTASAAIALAAGLAQGASAAAQQRTIINPVDIDYRYNFEQVNGDVSYRTGADPAIVNHKGAYYLFLTLADGYWRSTDLITWTFITPSQWPNGGVVAPALLSDGDRLILQPSHSFTQPTSIYVSDAPETGKLDYLVRRIDTQPNTADKSPEEMKPNEVPPGPWDPGLFKEDGQIYLYWGSSNVFPVYGRKIAFEGGRIIYQTPAEHLFVLKPEDHGWERFGQDHSGLLANGQPTKPYVEGAWMNKAGDTYYLQYGAPGTEFNAYANGVYVSDKPLGPFTYAPYNPIAYKPGGFVQGAGHGSSFQDRYGNWWNSGTPWIGYNWTFERRIDLIPGRIYPDGQMAFTSRFADFPFFAPTSKVEDPDSLFTGWMLLSYRAAATASSTRDTFTAGTVTDENPRTFWVAATKNAGETLTVDLGTEAVVRAVQVNFADYKSGRFADAPDIYTEFRIEGSRDGRDWHEIARTEPPRRDRPNAYLELKQPETLRFVRYVHGHIGGANLAISDLRVFGNSSERDPARPARIVARRHADTRDATISWQKVPGAVGYNIRFGIRPDRLTLTHQVWADELGTGAQLTKELRSLNKGVPYYVAVEAFNRAGVSRLSTTVPIR
ncbi:family 43 glycosylhydrolase [Sphingomonas sabuli]|uniref:Family 43 glycosylhydrolase n=1 Tax=Sphingomonas sabuli TaxID=2764186 RepID=A0A7G9KZU0_9SPHN|nr:family 43 glycosylhydrolase [Sphingomonas sabuli]QNM81889.1 family 43 glycosylhydrolase [Sphingomonas sabuli]